MEVHAPVEGRMAEVLTDDALAFVEGLQRRFGDTRRDLLRRRAERMAELEAGAELELHDGDQVQFGFVKTVFQWR